VCSIRLGPFSRTASCGRLGPDQVHRRAWRKPLQHLNWHRHPHLETPPPQTSTTHRHPKSQSHNPTLKWSGDRHAFKQSLKQSLKSPNPLARCTRAAPTDISALPTVATCAERAKTAFKAGIDGGTHETRRCTATNLATNSKYLAINIKTHRCKTSGGLT